MGERETEAKLMAQDLIEGLRRKRMTLVLAESCTGGLVAHLLAEVSGASAALWGSFVCYSPEAKQEMLGIEADFLEKHGLVSGDTAREMALRALAQSGASIAAAVTGIAGPFGDGSDTPVGTVWIASVREGDCREKEHHFQGDRSEIRLQAAVAVLEELLEIVVD